MAVQAMPLPPRLARARKTAAGARAVCALGGLAVLLASPQLHAHPRIAAAGFVLLLITSLLVRLPLSPRLVSVEEAVSALAAVLIVTIDEQSVTVLTLLWLCGALSGILGRGGRAHWAGRAIVVGALLLPVPLTGEAAGAYLAFCLGAVCLLLSGGRMTRELSGMLAEARHAADHDGLTGALSRAALRDTLQSRLAVREAAVIVIDLDGFGLVNKTHGHAAGDRMLQAAAERMRSVLAGEQVLGRVGGDEFAVVAEADASGLAERLRDALAEPSHDFDGIGASLGVARAPEHGDSADALLRAGDIALRGAKRGGGGRVLAYDGQSLTDLGPQGALGALGRLIAGDGLTMVTQPIYDIGTGTVHAYEALARFRTRSTSSPLHWLALAEEYGLRADLELACFRAGLALLPSRPAGTRLTVNLSARLLGDRRLTAILDRQDVDGLVIEITEDSLIGDEAAALEATAPLIARGIAIAVDDMGAGYSGLRQIASLRPGYLKIDRSLVTGIDVSPERAALVEALVGYARRTGGILVAEGVETEAELAAVRALGVPLVQGYLLGRPGPPFVDGSTDDAYAPGRSSAAAV